MLAILLVTLVMMMMDLVVKSFTQTFNQTILSSSTIRLLGQLCHKIADRKKLSDVKTEKKDEVDPKQPPTPLDPNNPGMGYLEAVANDLGILFQVYLNSKSAVQRMTTAWVVKEWAEAAYRDKVSTHWSWLAIG